MALATCVSSRTFQMATGPPTSTTAQAGSATSLCWSREQECTRRHNDLWLRKLCVALGQSAEDLAGLETVRSSG